MCGRGGLGTSGNAWVKGAWDPCFPSTQSHDKGVLMKCWGYREASGRLRSLDRWVLVLQWPTELAKGAGSLQGLGKAQAIHHELAAGSVPGGVYPCPAGCRGALATACAGQQFLLR